MIICFKFYTFPISDDQFFWRYSESKTNQNYPVKWGNFDPTWGNFNHTWGNFDVNKVNIIMVNKQTVISLESFLGQQTCGGGMCE